MRNAVIVSGARTPVGRFGGAFKDISAPDLGAAAIKTALDRAGITADMVDEVVIGNAIQAAEAGYAARLASIRSGIPHETPTMAINRQCSSGLEAINVGAQLIKTGEAEINDALANGFEVIRDFETGGGIVMALGKWERKDEKVKNEWNK